MASIDRIEELEKRVEELMARGGGGGGEKADPQTVVNGNVINGNVVINEAPTIVYCAPGSEDLSSLTGDVIQSLFKEKDTTAHEMLAECFRTVCCDQRVRKNHVYYVPNKKDNAVVLVRRGPRWHPETPTVAFVPTVRSLSKRLLDDQPSDMDTADITAPKVEAFKPLEALDPQKGERVPADLASKMMLKLQPRVHGELTPEELRESRRPAALEPEPKDEFDEADFADGFFD